MNWSSQLQRKVTNNLSFAIGLITVGFLAACGATGSDGGGSTAGGDASELVPVVPLTTATFPTTTSTPTPASIVTTTTTVAEGDDSAEEHLDLPSLDELLPPEGALPVIEVDISSGQSFQDFDLPPGHYRVRSLPLQADWPEVCLGESRIFSPMEGGTIEGPPDDIDPTDVGAWDARARALSELKRAALEPICNEFWADYDTFELPDGVTPPLTVPDGPRHDTADGTTTTVRL